MTDLPKPKNPEPSTENPAPAPSFFAELKRRKVFRVAATYIVVAWIIIQVAAATFPGFEIPMWAFRFVVMMIVLGFPVALLLAWAFELTPDGIKLTKNVSELEKSVTSQSKRNWTSIGFAAALPTVIFGALALYFYVTRTEKPESAPPQLADESADIDKSIAVLPFDNRSNLDEDQFFTDGIHDDLLTQISRIHDIKTISRTSVMAYKGTTKNMRTIGEELGVATLLEGGVQRAGSQVRINIQLIDAKTDAHLWADTYTRQLSAENVFAIQSEIASAIAQALKAVMSPDEQQQFEKMPTQNMEALEAYFRGRASYVLSTSEGFDEAIAHFKEAITLDPKFAEAHAQLGLAYLEKIYYGGLPSETQIALAAPLIDRALELNPALSEAYRALGYLKRYQNDVPASKAAFERAIELNPNNASAYEMYGNTMTWAAWDAASAVPLNRKAVELDPKSVGAKSQLGDALAQAGQFQEARDLLERVVAESPDFAQGYVALGGVLSRHLFQLDEAIKVLRQAVRLDPGNPSSAFRLSEVYRNIGLDAEAVKWYQRAISIDQAPGWKRYDLGFIHEVRGEKEAMIAAWEALTPADGDGWEWSILKLADYDIVDGHPEKARARFQQTLPDLSQPIASGLQRDKVRAYACVLLAGGERKLAQPYVDAYLKLRDNTNRLVYSGVGFGDAAIFLQMGDKASALAALRQWRDLGGRVDFTQFVYLTPLFDDPDFQALNNEMLADLAEQRANLARWEANGELAPIPEL